MYFFVHIIIQLYNIYIFKNKYKTKYIRKYNFAIISSNHNIKLNYLTINGEHFIIYILKH